MSDEVKTCGCEIVYFDAGSAWNDYIRYCQKHAAVDEVIEALEELAASMHPHPIDHPSMFAARRDAAALLTRIRGAQ